MPELERAVVATADPRGHRPQLAKRSMMASHGLRSSARDARRRGGIDLAAIKRPDDTFVHDLEGKLRCQKCSKRARPGERLPQGVLQQFATRRKNFPTAKLRCADINYAKAGRRRRPRN
jgi:hypothetical protein